MSGNNNNSPSSNDHKSIFGKADASRVQSAQAKAGHNVGADTFVSRAQSAGDKNANAAAAASGEGQDQGQVQGQGQDQGQGGQGVQGGQGGQGGQDGQQK